VSLRGISEGFTYLILPAALRRMPGMGDLISKIEEWGGPLAPLVSAIADKSLPVYGKISEDIQINFALTFPDDGLDLLPFGEMAGFLRLTGFGFFVGVNMETLHVEAGAFINSLFIGRGNDTLEFAAMGEVMVGSSSDFEIMFSGLINRPEPWCNPLGMNPMLCIDFPLSMILELAGIPALASAGIPQPVPVIMGLQAGLSFPAHFITSDRLTRYVKGDPVLSGDMYFDFVFMLELNPVCALLPPYSGYCPAIQVEGEHLSLGRLMYSFGLYLLYGYENCAAPLPCYTVDPIGNSQVLDLVDKFLEIMDTLHVQTLKAAINISPLPVQGTPFFAPDLDLKPGPCLAANPVPPPRAAAPLCIFADSPSVPQASSSPCATSHFSACSTLTCWRLQSGSPRCPSSRLWPSWTPSILASSRSVARWRRRGQSSGRRPRVQSFASTMPGRTRCVARLAAPAARCTRTA
jgi:hypothetical protein